jgi:hypothetical protein
MNGSPMRDSTDEQGYQDIYGNNLTDPIEVLRSEADEAANNSLNFV